jgi:hypothetical protein
MNNEQVTGGENKAPDKMGVNNPLTNEITEQNALSPIFRRSMFWKAERDSLSPWPSMFLPATAAIVDLSAGHCQAIRATTARPVRPKAPLP